jgi:hypothetical protein
MMSVRRTFLPLLLVVSLPLFAQVTTFRYTETNGPKTSTREYRILRTEGTIEVTATGDGETEKARWTSEAGTVFWQLSNSGAGTDVAAERTGDTVRVAGTFKGRKVARDIRIDHAPWYQVFGPLIAELLPAGSAQREFWVVNAEDWSAHRMQVRRIGVERIPVGGVATDALKVHFSPAGALAPFWGADFWYRPSDSTWIFSKLPENGGLTVATLEGTGS